MIQQYTVQELRAARDEVVRKVGSQPNSVEWQIILGLVEQEIRYAEERDRREIVKKLGL